MERIWEAIENVCFAFKNGKMFSKCILGQLNLQVMKKVDWHRETPNERASRQAKATV